ncbi:MAG TPA: hypothetical protein V6C78_22620 [Crinalium sp.]|jgi:hypothetical protein
MATITIHDLRPTGFDLFSDDETYISDLGDSELSTLSGGALFETFIKTIGQSSGYACSNCVCTNVPTTFTGPIVIAQPTDLDNRF